MAKKKLMTIREQLEAHILSVFDKVPLPGKKTNVASALHSVFVWQTISKLADSRLTSVWKAVQPSYMPEDETLREKGEGDFIFVEAGPYSGTVKVTQGRQMFDRDLFIDAIAKEYKIPRHELVTLSESCYSRTKRAVSKRVIEVLS